MRLTTRAQPPEDSPAPGVIPGAVHVDDGPGHGERPKRVSGPRDGTALNARGREDDDGDRAGRVRPSARGRPLGRGDRHARDRSGRGLRARARGRRGQRHLARHGRPAYPIRLAGFRPPQAKYRNRGRSLAGTAEAIGTSVTGFKAGDAVCGIGDASFAEHARARPDKLAPSRRTCPSSTRLPSPFPGSPPSKAFATMEQSRAGRRG